ncbi:MAG: aromatic-ring-hydroxylating dioxygenase subunit beta [Pigmentiphaga sp.]|nr:aromatic-ring-hydroxylating dioxygenase subunit beta [Pigmentiphaga sp.]
MKSTIENLVNQEARLLDEGKLDEWLSLYAEDATYWIPMDDKVDPLQDASIIFDNHLRLAMRVEQIQRQSRVAQNPPSLTMRMVTNLEIDQDTETTASARFCLHLTEVRAGDWRQRGLGEMRQLPGHCLIQARKENDGWKIIHKKIVLLNRYQPMVGLAFLV